MRPLRCVERTYRSEIAAEARGLAEVKLLTDGDGAYLRTESSDRLAIGRLLAPRTPTCIQARRA